MRLSPLLALAIVALAAVVPAQAQYEQSQIEFWNALGRDHLQQKLRWKAPGEKGPKNVIFFLGDGMGLSMVTSGRVIAAEKAGRDYRNQKWAFEKFDFSGLLKTSSYDYHTTDSAAGAMALFTGHKVEQNTLGRLPNFGQTCEKGEEAHINDGIAELALAKGLDVAVVSTTRVTDATPGANYAKGVHRLMEFDNATEIQNTKCVDIAQQTLHYPANKFKVLMGGGHAFFVPKAEGGHRCDGRNIEKEWLALPGGRRSLFRTLSDVHEHETGADDQVLGLFHDDSFNYHLDELEKKNTTQPRLVDMVKKALEVLQRSSNDKGYYMMVEGGHIDLAEHENKMNLATEELIEFSHTIDTVRGLVGEDTLIVVTADHGHALTLPGYVHKHNSILSHEVEPADTDVDGLPVPNVHFAVGPGHHTNRSSYTEEERKRAHFESPAAYPGLTGVHGGEDVGIWAQGPYSWCASLSPSLSPLLPLSLASSFSLYIALSQFICLSISIPSCLSISLSVNLLPALFAPISLWFSLNLNFSPSFSRCLPISVSLSLSPSLSLPLTFLSHPVSFSTPLCPPRPLFSSAITLPSLKSLDKDAKPHAQ